MGIKINTNARQCGKTLSYLKAVSELLDEATARAVSQKARKMMLISTDQLKEQHKKYLEGGFNPIIDALFKEVIHKSNSKKK